MSFVFPPLVVRRAALNAVLVSARSLTELRIADAAMGFEIVYADELAWNDEAAQKEHNRRYSAATPKRRALVAALVAQNPRLRIVRVPEDLVSPGFYEALVACRDLRSVEPQVVERGGARDAEGTWRPSHVGLPLAAVLQTWPALAFLDLTNSAVSAAQQAELLSIGLPLARLVLCTTSLHVLQQLARPSHLGLGRLALEIDFDTTAEAQAALVRELGQQLAALEQLSDLDLELDGVACPATVAGAVWRLPSVTKLRLQGYACEGLPQLAAPHLTELDVFPFEWPVLLPLLLGLPRLRRLGCHAFETYFAEPDLHVDECERFVAAVRAGAWPDLERLALQHTLPMTFCAALPGCRRLVRVSVELHPPIDVGYVRVLLTTAAPCVERLEVRAIASFRMMDHGRRGPDVPSLPSVAMESTVVVATHAHLRELHLDFARDETFVGVEFPALTKLNLASRHVSVDHLERVLAQMPALTALSDRTFHHDLPLTHLRWNETDGHRPHLALRSVRLTRSDIGDSDVLGLLESAPGLVKLGALSTVLTPALLVAIASMERAPQHLEKLELAFAAAYDAPAEDETKRDWTAVVVALVTHCPRLSRLGMHARLAIFPQVQSAVTTIVRERPGFQLTDPSSDFDSNF